MRIFLFWTTVLDDFLLHYYIKKPVSMKDYNLANRILMGISFVIAITTFTHLVFFAMDDIETKNAARYGKIFVTLIPLTFIAMFSRKQNFKDGKIDWKWIIGLLVLASGLGFLIFHFANLPWP